MCLPYQEGFDNMATIKKSKTATTKSLKKSAAPHAKASTSKKIAVKKSHSPIVSSVKKTATAKNPKAHQAPTPKKAAAKKDFVKPTVKTVPAIVHKTAHKIADNPDTKTALHAEQKKAHFSKNDLDQFKIDLLAMRDRITGQSGSMRNAALQRDDEVNPEEDGTDAFMRLQTLEQVSSQQLIITNINEALRAIEKGSYGVCDTCGELISKQRLSVLPFAKNCIKCQSEMERPNRPNGRR